MHSHRNAKNGEPAPLVAEDVYKIIMEVGALVTTAPGCRRASLPWTLFLPSAIVFLLARLPSLTVTVDSLFPELQWKASSCLKPSEVYGVTSVSIRTAYTCLALDTFSVPANACPSRKFAT